MASIPFENVPELSPLETLLAKSPKRDEPPPGESFDEHLRTPPATAVPPPESQSPQPADGRDEPAEPVTSENESAPAAETEDSTNDVEQSNEDEPAENEDAPEEAGTEKEADAEHDETAVTVAQDPLLVDIQPVTAQVEATDEETPEVEAVVDVERDETRRQRVELDLEPDSDAAVELAAENDAVADDVEVEPTPRQVGTRTETTTPREVETIATSHSDAAITTESDAADQAVVAAPAVEPDTEETPRRRGERSAVPTRASAAVASEQTTASPNDAPVELPESTTNNSDAGDSERRDSTKVAARQTAETVEAAGTQAATSHRESTRVSGSLNTRLADASNGPRLTNAQQDRFVGRVARAFQVAQSRGGELRLRLSPPELGSLRLEVRVQSGLLAARLEAETPQARTVLLDNLPVLRDRLAEQGIRIEQFDVELLDRQTGQQHLPDDNNQGEDRRQQRRASESPTTAPSESTATNTTPNDTDPLDGGLNVIV